MTPLELELFKKEVGTVLGEALKSRDERIAALEQAVEKCLKARGTWKSSEAYAINDVVNWSGSWWRCVCAHTSSGPTLDHDFWRLEVKHGRDGRDANGAAG